MKSDEQLIISLWGECKAGMHLNNINSIHSTHVQACVKQHLTVRRAVSIKWDVHASSPLSAMPASES